MDWSTSGKIKTTENINPTIGIPCPTGDRIVDNGCPDEDEDDTRKHATAFSSSANCESWSDGSEHTLENGECQVGDVSSLLSQNTFISKVLEIADERAGSVGEGKGITPEEPLVFVSN